MGADPYWYFVKYNPDIRAALNDLRQREFKAGRYNPVIAWLDFPIAGDSPAPGAQHATIEDALDAAGEDGSRSILDLLDVYDAPDFGGVAPFSNDDLLDIYGTTRPTRTMVEENQDYFDQIDSGMGVYILLYKDGVPDEILFAGYSRD